MSAQKKAARWFSWALAIIAAGLLIGYVFYLIMTFVVNRTLTDLQQPVLTMEGTVPGAGGELEYTTQNRGYCPGDSVYWQPNKIVRRDADARVWRTMKQQDGDTTKQIWFNEDKISLEAGDHIRDVHSMTIPDGTQAGEYYILNSLHHIGSGTQLARYRVSFMVRNDCQTPEPQ